MEAFDDDRFGRQARQLRLDTLIWLRWLAVVGQAGAVFAARFGLGLRFPVLACIACIAASVALNLWLRGRLGVARRLNDRWASAILGYDIVQLAALLGLTGGLTNPFSILLLAPVMTSAVSLPWRQTLTLLGLALFCATLLEFWRLPLHGPDGAPIETPALYNAGLWAAIAVSAVFISIYGYRVASEARQLASALTATELVLARAQHLSQLDGLAAAAAHELGTPLATVALVVHELSGLPEVSDHCADDLRLVKEQIARCRTILARLSAPTDMALASIQESGLSDLIEEVATPHRLQDVEIEVKTAGEGVEPVCRRNPAMIYGLTNILENAVSYARAKVSIRASWTSNEVKIVISDDGPGFPAHVLAQLGEPYISDRSSARRGEGEVSGGLGLGLFIAKALLERVGARLDIGNARPPGRGAIATITWPMSAFEQGRRSPRPRLDSPANSRVSRESA